MKETSDKRRCIPGMLGTVLLVTVLEFPIFYFEINTPMYRTTMCAYIQIKVLYLLKGYFYAMIPYGTTTTARHIQVVNT